MVDSARDRKVGTVMHRDRGRFVKEVVKRTEKRVKVTNKIIH